MNQREREAALARNPAAVPDRQRADAGGRGCSLEGDQRRPDERLRQHRSQRGPASASSRRSASAAGRPCTTGSDDGAMYLSARMPRWAATRRGQRLDARRAESCRTGRSRRSRSTAATLPDRVPGLCRPRRRDPERPVARGSGRRTAGCSCRDISGNLPDTSVNSVVLDPSYRTRSPRRH